LVILAGEKVFCLPAGIAFESYNMKKRTKSGRKSFSAWLTTAPKSGESEVVTLSIQLPTEDWLTLQSAASKHDQELSAQVAEELHGCAHMYRKAKR
jgi:hypothetical protein